MKFIYLVTFVTLVVCQETPHAERQNIVIEAGENSMKFGQKIDESVQTKKKKSFNISEHRLIVKATPDGRPYGIYDGIIPSKYQVLVKTYLTHDHESWLFNNYDADNVNKQRTHDNTPWINDRDPFEFAKTKLCKRLVRAVKDVSKDDGPYYPYRVFGKIIRRGDHTRVSADSQDEGDFSVMIFLNEYWKKNYYGEFYFYDKDREIIGGSTHKAGRVAVWESTILRLNRPPSVQFLQGQILFQVQFSKNKDKMIEGQKLFHASQQERKEAYEKWFLQDYKLPNGEPFTPRDPEKHKTFEFTTKTDGRKIFVYDDLFPQDLLDHLRGFVLKYGSYFYDDSIDKDSDNVQWIAGLLLDPYIKSPYWKIVQSVAKHATNSSKMFPYDVSINLVRSSDHTRIHGDVGYYGEEEFTCLVYLNPNWTRNYYGETTYFEKNSDDTEIVAQVRPRYGRTVIFDGNIPHSARPPSFNFSGARLTFVTKLHKDEYTGRKKNFQEELRHFKSAISGLDALDLLNSRRGEKYARQQIEGIRKMMESLAFRSDYGGDVEEQSEEKQDEEEGLGQPGEQQPNEARGEKQSDEEMERQRVQATGEVVIPPDDQGFGEEEGDSEQVVELLGQLKGVTSDSPDGVEKLIKVHSQMVKDCEEISEDTRQKIIQVM